MGRDVCLLQVGVEELWLVDLLAKLGAVCTASITCADFVGDSSQRLEISTE